MNSFDGVAQNKIHFGYYLILNKSQVKLTIFSLVLLRLQNNNLNACIFICDAKSTFNTFRSDYVFFS